MRGLEIRGGMADGFYTRDSRSETGYWFGLAMSRYAKNAEDVYKRQGLRCGARGAPALRLRGLLPGVGMTAQVFTN